MSIRTSKTHPITVSWIIGGGEGEGDAEGEGEGGALGLSYCPGKKVVRDGVRWERNMKADLSRLRDHYRATTIVNLLSVYELRGYGIYGYSEAVAQAKLGLVDFPIIEMAAPENMEEAAHVVEDIVRRVEGGERVIAHCRGGVGRAGTIAACSLLLMGKCTTAAEAIAEVRARRCKRAVESRTQERFIASYCTRLQSLE